MGDLGDYWREHREYLKSKGISRSRPRPLAVPGNFTKKWANAGFRKCSPWHWQAKVGGDLLDYWPSKSRYRWRGVTKTATGDVVLALITEKLPRRGWEVSHNPRVHPEYSAFVAGAGQERAARTPALALLAAFLRALASQENRK